MTKGNDSQTKKFWIVTALGVCVLIFVLFQFNRARMAIRLTEFIHNLTPAAPQPYLLISGIFWATAGLVTIWWLVRRHPFAPNSLRAIAVLYSINYWVEQLWLAQSELRKVNWTFSAALNVFLLLILFLILSLPFVRKIFGDHNGKEPQN
jgi:hypothetical protein